MLINDFTLQAYKNVEMLTLTNTAYSSQVDDEVISNLKHILK